MALQPVAGANAYLILSHAAKAANSGLSPSLSPVRLHPQDPVKALGIQQGARHVEPCKLRELLA